MPMIPEPIAAAVVAAMLLGLRHGADYDHIAAIADLTAAASRPVRGVGLSMLYGAGHALIVFALGALAVAFGLVLPEGSELIMQRVVGLTLILLGGYVLHAVLMRGDGARLPSRFDLLARAWRWFARNFIDDGHASRHPHNARPGPGTLGAFMVGVIHGIGAETPTQLALFVLAAGIGGWSGGLVCVGAFVAGLLATNLLMALFSAGVLNLSAARERIYRAVMLTAGAYSVALGLLFLVSGLDLPPLS
jgi:high-affinity nickel-transport protein